jgi:hypothetical protein
MPFPCFTTKNTKNPKNPKNPKNTNIFILKDRIQGVIVLSTPAYKIDYRMESLQDLP